MAQVEDEKGKKRWKQVEVDLKEHINVPVFPTGISVESYDEYLNEYLSGISVEQLPQNRPLWDIHIIKYPTSNAAGTLIFKLHHALGDGYSLIGALFACLQRVDDPSLPLTFPSRQTALMQEEGMFKRLPRIVSRIFKSVPDLGWGVLKSTMIEDDLTPIRSGNEAKFRPITISNVSFSLDDIKKVKTMLKVVIP